MILARELRAKSVEELDKELLELRRTQFELRIQKSIGQYSDVSKFKENRRDIARTKTVLNERRDEE